MDSEISTFTDETNAKTMDDDTATVAANINVMEDGNKEEVKAGSKRKRKSEEKPTFDNIADVFLRMTYPLSTCMMKNVTAGLLTSENYLPHVILNQGIKGLYFSEAAWDNMTSYLPIFECYLLNNVYGRKTAVRIASSDIEVESIKLRGIRYIRFKDLTKHDIKIQLTSEEFTILTATSFAITRYVKQLSFVLPIVKDYLNDTMNRPDLPLLYGPIDTSIYNRLPQDVYLWRQIKQTIKQTEDIVPEIAAEEEDYGGEEEEDVVENKSEDV